MEGGNIIEFFENKTILITGVTGFLAKLFIEKIMRVQPNVKKLYLLLRASDSTSANERFHNEVIEKELFRVAKEKLGGNFETIISKKIKVIAGDVGHEDLGIKDSPLIQEIKNNLDFLLNFAATINFGERYDVALNTNTLGAMNVLCFAKSCPKLLLLVHISTAYVCGERSGLIDENSFAMGETLSGVSKLSIDEEKKIIETKLHELRAEGATETTIKSVMKDLGIQRARKYGWPNTYVFTKAMGEMIIEHMKGNLPVIIIRPTMVTSTFQQPFPGWIEGVKTIDAIIAGYGMGKLKFFVADLSAIVDLIPADMVINAIIIAMVAHEKKPSNNSGIYHVGSSSRNPLTCLDFKNYLLDYFAKKPYKGEDGKTIKVSSTPTILKSIDNFHRFVSIRYTPFLKALELANQLLCNHLERKYNIMDRKIKFAKKLVDLYKPYLFFHGIFVDSNVVKLLKEASENGVDGTFFFDVKVIDWNDYFMNIHIPGIVKYALKR